MSAFGLTALFEAMESTKVNQEASDALFEAFTDAIDDDVKMMVAGDELPAVPDSEDEDLAIDMAGYGIDDTDAEKYKRLCDMIPEDDEDMDERIEEIVETVIPNEEDL